MKSPTERRTGGEELPRAARDLLRKSARPVPPTAAERAAMAAMAARIAAVPLPPAPRGVWSKLAALGGGKGVGIAGVVLAVGGATWLGATMLGRGGTQEGAPQAASAKAMDEGAAPGGAERGAAVAETAPVENAGDPLANGGGQSAKSGSPGENGSLVQGGNRGAVTGHPVTGSGRAPAIAGEPATKSGSPPGARKASSGAPAGPAAVAVVARASAGKGASAAKGAVVPAEGGAVPGPGKAAPAAPVSACPAGPAASGDRAAEGPILAAAARALASSPVVTLACIQTLSKIGGPFQLGDEHAFLGFEASRLLGREADAKRFARALLRASPGSAYAAKAKAYLGDDTAP